MSMQDEESQIGKEYYASESEDDKLLGELFDGLTAFELGKWAYGARSFVNPFDYHDQHDYWREWEDGYDAARNAQLELEKEASK